jgi:hypothetical protein
MTETIIYENSRFELNLNCTVIGKQHFLNSSQNERLSPSCIHVAVSFDGFGSISWHCLVLFPLFYRFTIFWISNFFGLSLTEETLLVEMRIWCIKIGIVLVWHINVPADDGHSSIQVTNDLLYVHVVIGDNEELHLSTGRPISVWRQIYIFKDHNV